MSSMLATLSIHLHSHTNVYAIFWHYSEHFESFSIYKQMFPYFFDFFQALRTVWLLHRIIIIPPANCLSGWGTSGLPRREKTGLPRHKSHTPVVSPCYFILFLYPHFFLSPPPLLHPLSSFLLLQTFLFCLILPHSPVLLPSIFHSMKQN